MERTNYEALTVKELKDISRQRGMTLEYKGHKFNKSELIDRLLKNDAEQKDIQDDIQKAIEEAGEVKQEVKKEVETKQTEVKQEGIRFAKTLEEIETKYSNRKRQDIYDNELKVGSYVVFIHYVEPKHGGIYKKLRTAKVVGVNRKQELVRVETLLGTEKQLSFDDLLYIKGSNKECTYPKDITTYLKQQRTEKGKELINEKFTEGIIAN